MAGKNSLSGVLVERAMRRQVNRLPQDISISSGINELIKFKINGLLSVDDNGVPAGVLSKTDIMGAYYAGIEIAAPLEYIMSRPPLFCSFDDPLETALEQMKEHGVYRLYVVGEDRESVVGSLAYPDIVGLLYQYCCSCDYNHASKSTGQAEVPVKRTLVAECMSRDVKGVGEDESLVAVMEELSSYRMGAVLVQDQSKAPVGVISKTDLILAYKHGVDPNEPAHSIMSRPVKTCRADELLEDAIRTMIFNDLHRLFVCGEESDDVVGVFTLTDAARNKSGSCHACISSRITV